MCPSFNILTLNVGLNGLRLQEQEIVIPSSLLFPPPHPSLPRVKTINYLFLHPGPFCFLHEPGTPTTTSDPRVDCRRPDLVPCVLVLGSPRPGRRTRSHKSPGSLPERFRERIVWTLR